MDGHQQSGGHVACQHDLWHPLDHVVRTSLEALLGDEQMDAVLYMTTELEEEPALDVADTILDVASNHPLKPIVSWRYSASISPASVRLEQSGRVLAYPSCERAVRTLAALATYYQGISPEQVGGEDLSF